MHSSELPITEWWDPAWDVYDVPSTPQQSLAPDPEVRIADSGDWWAAYDHNATVVHIMTGRRWYGPDNFYAHQLTTGYDDAERLIEFTRSTIGASLLPWQEAIVRAYFAPEVVRCECWPLETALGQPPEMEQNPDCQLHWAEVHLIPCSCRYQQKLMRVVLPPNGPHGRARRTWVTDYRFFQIDPDCVWHGDDWETYVYGLEAIEPELPPELSEPCFYAVLDEAERLRD